jgi:hypothetical protein
MSSAGFQSLYFSAYNQFLFHIQIYQFSAYPRIAYLANVSGCYSLKYLIVLILNLTGSPFMYSVWLIQFMFLSIEYSYLNSLESPIFFK